MAHICTTSLACHAKVDFILVSMGDDVTRNRSIMIYIIVRHCLGGFYRPTKSHALGVSLTHLSVISRSHACHLPYYANLTHFSQKSSKMGVVCRFTHAQFTIQCKR